MLVKSDENVAFCALIKLLKSVYIKQWIELGGLKV